MDITQVAIVMSFGALAAAAGLALLIFRREQAENKIKLFGQEFQISTPALVVFLVGCFVFMFPVVVQLQNPTVLSIHPWQSEDKDTKQQTTNAPEVSHQITVAEGNHQIATAKLVPIGTTIKGVITKGQRDFFKFKTGKGLRTRVIVRKTSYGGFSAELSIYDNVEKKVASTVAHEDDTVSLVFESSPNSYYYAEIQGYYDYSAGPYELLIKEEQSPDTGM
jgi:hypothetical protein